MFNVQKIILSNLATFVINIFNEFNFKPNMWIQEEKMKFKSKIFVSVLLVEVEYRSC